MYVIKRDGRKESVHFDKISERITKLCKGLDENHISAIKVAKRVIAGVHDGVTTQSLDELAAETAATMATQHHSYAQLASRIAISNLHKLTASSFSNTMKSLYEYKDERSGKSAPLLSKKSYGIIKAHAKLWDESIVHARDYLFDYFGFKTLERSYLMRINHRIAERPQYLFMRVSIGIHEEDIEKVLQTYHLLSEKWFTHATPTLFNAGTPKPQLSSCFLLAMKDDSIDGIYDTLKQCAKISQSAGGVGLSIHNIRATGAYIKGTGGTSNGIIPMLRNFDMTARYVDQGGGKRKGSFAIYLEPWHADILEFLDLKKNHGKEELRARDLFYALWICDLFMKRVKENGTWSLFCPSKAPGLENCWGKEFEILYTKYEREGLANKTIPAQELWFKIMEAQIETGVPYILYKDACNRKSNQQNLGTIKSSNLCTEITEYTSPDEVAVCNLASLCLPKYIKKDADGSYVYDFQKLYEVTCIVTENLNKVIDVNSYPVEEARNSNMRHRPIGIGVQGLADTFIQLRYPFDSPQARQLNKDIFETIYYAAMQTSMELAKKEGPYESYNKNGGCPVSKGIFQFDMWGVEPSSGKWDWITLKQNVKKYGVRNSLLVAPMPTASTSQIMGNNECFEPYTSNIYVRRTLSGEFIVINKHLLRDLIQLGLWDEDMRNHLIAEHGSVQNIKEIPDDLKKLYRTVWEIPQRAIIDMSCDRAPYICQSHSLNIHMEAASFAKLTSMHFYAWQKGLKTGMYYLRTKPAANAIAFTVDKERLQKSKEKSATPISPPTPISSANSTLKTADLGTCHREDECEACSG